ncbi:MAG: tetratricopeptide repeat protein [Bacteroidales bacterium]|nr:tetratricopeptide repeat protein [Bacteroidales bacterium]
MTIKEISQFQTDVYQLLDDARIYEAIIRLMPVVEEVADYELKQKFNTAKVSYDYMLQYLIAGVHDDGRDQMVHQVTETLYGVVDKCVISLSAKQSYDLFYTKASVLQNETIEALVAKYLSEKNKCDLLTSAPDEGQNAKVIAGLSRQMETVAVDLFNKVWCSFPLTGADAGHLQQFFATAPEHVKQLLLAAMLLGQTKFYDEAKLAFLLEAYITQQEAPTQTRALTGAIIAMLLHPQRVQHSQRVKQLLAQASEGAHFHADVVSIMHRLVRSRNAENVTKRMREELMPDLMNIKPELVSKLKNSQSVDPAEFEENPQWQEWLDKSGMSKKMEELNKLQMEGEDVYVSAFSRLKSFPFFNTMANWFLPFYPSHSTLHDAFPGENRKLLSVMDLTPFLCDSDKYSLCFAMASVPDAQKQAMAGQMGMHDKELREVVNAELPDGDKLKRDGMINAYIQSLYRFFTMFSRRGDFKSVFATKMDFTTLPLLDVLGLEQSTFCIAAEYYLKNGFYADAATYFAFIQQHFADTDPQLLQKMGFAYQNMGDNKKALQYYLRYELADDADLWNHRQVATCYRALKNYEKALEYYQKVLAVKQSNAVMCLNAGHCLLSLDRPDEALNYYYKADYIDGANPKVWRSLAWVQFLLGNYDQSGTYYEKLLASATASALDRLNYGHLLLCTGRAEQAVDQYALSAKGDDQALRTFLNAYCADIPVLLQKGVDPDLAVMAKEAVIKKLNNN